MNKRITQSCNHNSLNSFHTRIVILQIYYGNVSLIEIEFSEF